MAGFRSNMTENLIFSLKYRQRKVDLNVNEKSLVFVTLRHLYVQLSYTKISYLYKNTHLQKNAAFLHFCLKESSENMIFLWNGNVRNPTKKMIFSVFFTNFRKTKILFFMQCCLLVIVALSVLIDILLHSFQLERSRYDYLWRSDLIPYNFFRIPSLTWPLVLYLLFCLARRNL